MELKQEVLADLKNAMKEKNTASLEAIRAVKAAIDKFEKENVGTPINYVKALQPLSKQRMDSIEKYKEAGNEELANKEYLELVVILSYLKKVQPKQLSDQELRSILDQHMLDNLLTKNDIGKIMSFFKNNYDGQYDGKNLSAIVKSL